MVVGIVYIMLHGIQRRMFKRFNFSLIIDQNNHQSKDNGKDIKTIINQKNKSGSLKACAEKVKALVN